MAVSFNMYELAGEFRQRWKLIAVACAAAAALSLLATLSLPKQYTAVARLVIEPPAGSDGRVSMVMSPQYLESLKTYESFVTGDSLFRAALEKFGLRAEVPGRPIEVWKKRMLKAGLVRSTKILEIAVTFEDPKRAQAIAQYLAEESARASAAWNREAGDEMIRNLEGQMKRAQQEYDHADAHWSRLAQSEPVEPLESEVRALETLLSRIDRARLNAPSQSSDAADRGKAMESLTKAATVLAQRKGRLDQAAEKRKMALAAFESTRKQHDAARSGAGFGGERLRLIDPGIVPEQPSSPSLRLNLLAAVLFALAATSCFITLAFGFRLSPRRTPDRYYAVHHGVDE